MTLIVPLESPKIRDDESRLPSPIVKRDPSTFENYLRDASNFQGRAEALAIPFSEKQISDYLKDASSKKIPVTAEGAHTGVTGGGIPLSGAALSLEKLSRISEIREGSIRVEPGVALRDLQDHVDLQGYLYTPDPTERTAQVGATVATNASGPRTFKYGPTRSAVKSMRLVLTTGDVLHLERGKYRVGDDRKVILESPAGTKISFQIPTYVIPKIKHVAGYYVTPKMDLMDLFIGSEGTLGVITELELFVMPRPERFFSLVAFFKTEEDSIRFGIEARRKSYETRARGLENEIGARSLEYLDSFSLHRLEKKFPQIPRNAQAAVFLEQVCSRENEEPLLEAWMDLMARHEGLADGSWVGLTHEKQEEFRAFRHEIPVIVNELMARRGLRKVGTDMAVPDEALEAMMKSYKDTIQESGLDSVTFGHLGNNHMHVNLLPRDQEEFDRAWALYRRWIEKVIELGGTISAEHGIGKIKIPYLEMMFGPAAIKEMASVKRSLDPDWILGRGNIFKG